MTCKFGPFNVVITRAIATDYNPEHPDLIAMFSFNLVDPKTKIAWMVCNQYSLRGKENNWKIYSRCETMDNLNYNPNEKFDEKLNNPYRPLFFTSFFPGAEKDPTIKELKKNFYNDLAKAVLNKLEYFRNLNNNENSMKERDVIHST